MSARGTGQGRSRKGRLLRRVMGGFLLLAMVGMGAFVVLYVLVGVPTANARATAQSNVYRTADGKVVARTGEVNRDVVAITEVPKAVQYAFVAAENKTFYDDNGVDLKGAARGLFNTVTGKGSQGGSTITQQYVKNYYLTQEQSATRKVKELFIALKVDQQMRKDDILIGYMNTAYYGRGAYGIQAAAQAYYGVDVGELDVGQGAYLAALLQAPSQYDMATATETGKRLATNRWGYVLDNMVDMNWLDRSERSAAEFPKLIAPKPAPGLSGQTGYLVEAANNQLDRDGVVSEQELAAGGWTITLTIDGARQKALEKAVESELTDDLDPADRTVDAAVQAGAASVDTRTGEVVALYGGTDYTEHYRSNATRTDYQVASTFKPVVLASALDNGAKTQDGREITPATVYDGSNRRPVEGASVSFAPPNEDEVDYGNVTVQKAMDSSVNSVYAQMAVDVGIDRVKDTAVALGLPEETAEKFDGPAVALGTMGASPLQMAGIYATLDNHGKLVVPTIVKSAERAGEQIEMTPAVGDQVIDRETADTVTSVLTGVVENGTGRAARQQVEAAGKTGTSDGNRSAWFTGYTPGLVTSVGLFGEEPGTGNHTSLKGAGGGGRVNGGGYPAEIWAAYTWNAVDGDSPAEFDLEIDQGAAVTPETTPAPSETTATSTPTPSESPAAPAPTPSTSTPAPTRSPTTPAPTQSSTAPGTPSPPPSADIEDPLPGPEPG